MAYADIPPSMRPALSEYDPFVAALGHRNARWAGLWHSQLPLQDCGCDSFTWMAGRQGRHTSRFGCPKFMSQVLQWHRTHVLCLQVIHAVGRIGAR
eukprot:scaffold118443_cov27-Tisochrysis_lutea.AAC.2